MGPPVGEAGDGPVDPWQEEEADYPSGRSSFQEKLPERIHTESSSTNDHLHPHFGGQHHHQEDGWPQAGHKFSDILDTVVSRHHHHHPPPLEQADNNGTLATNNNQTATNNPNHQMSGGLPMVAAVAISLLLLVGWLLHWRSSFAVGKRRGASGRRRGRRKRRHHRSLLAPLSWPLARRDIATDDVEGDDEDDDDDDNDDDDDQGERARCLGKSGRVMELLEDGGLVVRFARVGELKASPPAKKTKPLDTLVTATEGSLLVAATSTMEQAPHQLLDKTKQQHRFIDDEAQALKASEECGGVSDLPWHLRLACQLKLAGKRSPAHDDHQSDADHLEVGQGVPSASPSPLDWSSVSCSDSHQHQQRDTLRPPCTCALHLHGGSADPVLVATDGAKEGDTSTSAALLAATSDAYRRPCVSVSPSDLAGTKQKAANNHQQPWQQQYKKPDELLELQQQQQEKSKRQLALQNRLAKRQYENYYDDEQADDLYKRLSASIGLEFGINFDSHQSNMSQLIEMAVASDHSASGRPAPGHLRSAAAAQQVASGCKCLEAAPAQSDCSSLAGCACQQQQQQNSPSPMGVLVEQPAFPSSLESWDKQPQSPVLTSRSQRTNCKRHRCRPLNLTDLHAPPTPLGTPGQGQRRVSISAAAADGEPPCASPGAGHRRAPTCRHQSLASTSSGSNGRPYEAPNSDYAPPPPHHCQLYQQQQQQHQQVAAGQQQQKSSGYSSSYGSSSGIGLGGSGSACTNTPTSSFACTSFASSSSHHHHHQTARGARNSVGPANAATCGLFAGSQTAGGEMSAGGCPLLMDGLVHPMGLMGMMLGGGCRRPSHHHAHHCGGGGCGGDNLLAHHHLPLASRKYSLPVQLESQAAESLSAAPKSSRLLFETRDLQDARQPFSPSCHQQQQLDGSLAHRSSNQAAAVGDSGRSSQALTRQSSFWLDEPPAQEPSEGLRSEDDAVDIGECELFADDAVEQVASLEAREAPSDELSRRAAWSGSSRLVLSGDSIETVRGRPDLSGGVDNSQTNNGSLGGGSHELGGNRRASRLGQLRSRLGSNSTSTSTNSSTPSPDFGRPSERILGLSGGRAPGVSKQRMRQRRRAGGGRTHSKQAAWRSAPSTVTISQRGVSGGRSLDEADLTQPGEATTGGGGDSSRPPGDTELLLNNTQEPTFPGHEYFLPPKLRPRCHYQASSLPPIKVGGRYGLAALGAGAKEESVEGGEPQASAANQSQTASSASLERECRALWRLRANLQEEAHSGDNWANYHQRLQRRYDSGYKSIETQNNSSLDQGQGDLQATTSGQQLPASAASPSALPSAEVPETTATSSVAPTQTGRRAPQSGGRRSLPQLPEVAADVENRAEEQEEPGAGYQPRRHCSR